MRMTNKRDYTADISRFVTGMSEYVHITSANAFIIKLLYLHTFLNVVSKVQIKAK